MKKTEDTIIIERDFAAPIQAVFTALTDPKILVKWHHAGDGWTTPYAEIDLKAGGKLKIAYADPDSAIVFDLEATIAEVSAPYVFSYVMQMEEMIKGDDRLVAYSLTKTGKNTTHMRLEFDVEHLNDRELQRAGWSQHYDNLAKVLEESL
jgi:uncharacterized protein YndB with AHSA1/START domain